jgi:hypothetical protein
MNSETRISYPGPACVACDGDTARQFGKRGEASAPHAGQGSEPAEQLRAPPQPKVVQQIRESSHFRDHLSVNF